MPRSPQRRRDRANWHNRVFSSFPLESAFMAKKPSAPAVPIDPKPVIIAAALRLGAERAWSEIALADIAAAAGLGLIELYRVFPSKLAILDGLARQTDAAVLAVPADAGDRPRDRLFDVLMRRFDTLLPSRPALKRIAADMQRSKLRAFPPPAGAAPSGCVSWVWPTSPVSGSFSTTTAPISPAPWRRSIGRSGGSNRSSPCRPPQNNPRIRQRHNNLPPPWFRLPPISSRML